MYGLTKAVFVLSAVIITQSRAQLTNIAGSTSVSLRPTDATCGRSAGTSADSSCQTICEDRGPTYRDLLRGVSGFNYDGSVTNTTEYFSDDSVTVAMFSKTTRLAFLRGSINGTTLDEFTLTFRIRPDDMDTER